MNMNINKPKIATIAFQRAINYGAVLQVYALQRKIEELGGTCTVLDYRNRLLESKHKEMRISDSKSIKDYIRFVFLSRNHNKKYRAFRKFSKKYLNLSKPYYNVQELKEDVNNYDKFITGSDQVWNGNISETDPAYFLDFVNNIVKKNSYAASFGFKEIPKGKEYKYYNMLKNYNYMSIREKQGASIIKDLINKDVDVVLDPTLLLSKEQWYEIIKDYTKHKDYILIYGFAGSENQIEFAKNLSRKTGYKIIHIANPYFRKLGFIYERAPGPREFLGLFKNAKYIVTNSFHGTAFSINLNKEFFMELLPESSGVNSRLEDILDLFELRDRQILSTDISIIDRPIDYIKVNQILEEEREKSLAFLEKIIHE